MLYACTSKDVERGENVKACMGTLEFCLVAILYCQGGLDDKVPFHDSWWWRIIMFNTTKYMAFILLYELIGHRMMLQWSYLSSFLVI
jgi:hypothetical protein